MTNKQIAGIAATIGLVTALIMVGFGWLWAGVLIGLTSALAAGWMAGTRMAQG